MCEACVRFFNLFPTAGQSHADAEGHMIDALWPLLFCSVWCQFISSHNLLCELSQCLGEPRRPVLEPNAVDVDGVPEGDLHFLFFLPSRSSMFLFR